MLLSPFVRFHLIWWLFVLLLNRQGTVGFLSLQ